MKLKCPLLLKPLATIVQENSQSFYPSEPIRISHFTMRHPVIATKIRQKKNTYSCKYKHGKRFWTPMKIGLAGIPKVCLKRTPWRLLKACLKFWHILNAHCSPLAMFFESDFDMGEKKRNCLSVWQLTTCILSLYSRKWTYLINAGRNSKIVMFFSSRRFFRKMNRQLRYFYLKTMIEFLSELNTGNFIRR